MACDLSGLTIIEFYEALRTRCRKLIHERQTWTISIVYCLWAASCDRQTNILTDDEIYSTERTLARTASLVEKSFDSVEDDIDFYEDREAYAILTGVLEQAKIYFNENYDPLFSPEIYSKYSKALKDFEGALEG